MIEVEVSTLAVALRIVCPDPLVMVMPRHCGPSVARAVVVMVWKLNAWAKGGVGIKTAPCIGPVPDALRRLRPFFCSLVVSKEDVS